MAPFGRTRKVVSHQLQFEKRTVYDYLVNPILKLMHQVVITPSKKKGWAFFQDTIAIKEGKMGLIAGISKSEM